MKFRRISVEVLLRILYQDAQLKLDETLGTIHRNFRRDEITAFIPCCSISNKTLLYPPPHFTLARIANFRPLPRTSGNIARILHQFTFFRFENQYNNPYFLWRKFGRNRKFRVNQRNANYQSTFSTLISSYNKSHRTRTTTNLRANSYPSTGKQRKFRRRTARLWKYSAALHKSTVPHYTKV